MSNVNAGTITVRVEGKDIGLSDLLNRINAQMAASGSSARNYASQMASIDPTLKRTESEMAKYATSLASVAAAQGDSVGAQRLLVGGLQQITANTTAANQVLLKLQQSINAEALAAEKDALALKRLADEKARLNNANPSGDTDPNDSKTASLGRLVTAYFVATRVVKEFADVINQGNELEKTLTTFRVLSGSAEQYEKNIALAKSQQQQFGGSLNDTVEGMSSFANLSARTGIEINKLTNTARALATVDPAQGFKGAGIALKEFFSGEVTSLARRFEIPREALNGIEKITDQKAKFEELTRVLETFGISQELVAAQAGTTAVQYDKLAGNVKDAIAAVGQFLAQTLLPVAQQISAVAAEAASGFNALITRADQLKGFSSKIFDNTATGGIDAFNQAIRDTNAAIDGNDPVMGRLLGHLQELSPAEYAFVAAQRAAGASAVEAMTALSANSEAITAMTNALGDAAQLYPENIDSIQQLNTALASNAAQFQNGAAVSLGLAEAVAAGLPVEQAMIELKLFQANAIRQAAEAKAADTAQTNAALTATELFTTAVTANALEQANSKVQGDALKLTQEQLYNAALAAAQGMGATQASAAALAGQFGITTQEAYNLIGALSQLEVAKAKQALGVTPGGANEREDRLGTNEDIIQRAKDVETRKKLAAIQFQNALGAADTAGKLQLEKDALARLNKGSVEYETQLGKVQAAERALQAEKDRDAKKHGGAPKLTPNEKINTKLLDDQDKFNDKFEDAEQKHWDKVADIYEKFNDAQQKQFAKNEVSKRRSRADFYAGLQDAPAGVDTQKFAAQYEEAFAKAQEIAQSGKAKLAAEFLDLRQKQIEEMKQLDEEAAKITQGQKEGKINKKDAEAQLAFLAGRRKLIEDAQKEEQDQLLAAGDDNVNNLNDQLSKEEQAYSDSVDKISLSAERAADAKIKHSERSKIVVSAENKVLADQAGYYDKIAKLNGGQVPASARKAPIPTSSGGTQGDKDETVDVSASSPIPVTTTTEALIVRQAELFVVHDADVMSAIGDMAARIEGKLGEVVSAVNGAKDTISNAVKSVESAVGRIRLNAPSVVGN